MASRRPLHILVVDHDGYMVDVTTQVLERMGYTTQGETESLKALRAFSDDPKKFDLAIIEPVMPVLMGIELAVRFRRIQKGFPVMLYTGYIDASLAGTLKTLGLRQPVIMPLYSQELREAVREAVASVPD